MTRGKEVCLHQPVMAIPQPLSTLSPVLWRGLVISLYHEKKKNATFISQYLNKTEDCLYGRLEIRRKKHCEDTSTAASKAFLCCSFQALRKSPKVLETIVKSI